MDRFTGLRWDERAARVMIAIAFEPSDTVTGSLVDTEGPLATLRLADSDGPVPGLGAEEVAGWRGRAQARLNPEHVDRAFEQADRQGVRLLIRGDREWPNEVDQLGSRTPFALWAKGTSPSLAHPEVARIAVVGARAATKYGYDTTTELTADLAQSGVHIVSGGSYGIDAAAHRAAALNGTTTIAVMASGLDRFYPAGNSDLFDRIAETGVILTELPPGTAPTRWRLQQRTRLMAALSDGVLLVEAGVRSSAFDILREANTLRRPVGAVPGPITSPNSAGPNLLIQGRQAMLVTSASDARTFLLSSPVRLDRERHFAEFETAAATDSPTPGGFHR